MAMGRARRDHIAEWLHEWRHSNASGKAMLLLCLPRLPPAVKGEVFANLLPYALSGAAAVTAPEAERQLELDATHATTASEVQDQHEDGAANSAVPAVQQVSGDDEDTNTAAWSTVEVLKHTVVAAVVRAMLEPNSSEDEPAAANGENPSTARSPRGLGRQPKQHWLPVWRRYNDVASGHGASWGISSDEGLLAREVIISGIVSSYVSLLRLPLLVTVQEERVDPGVEPDAFGNFCTVTVVITKLSPDILPITSAWESVCLLLASIARFGRALREVLIELGVSQSCEVAVRKAHSVIQAIQERTVETGPADDAAVLNDHLRRVCSAVNKVATTLGPCGRTPCGACGVDVVAVNAGLLPQLRELHAAATEACRCVLSAAERDAPVAEAGIHETAADSALPAGSAPSASAATTDALYITQVSSGSDTSDEDEIGPHPIIVPIPKAPSVRLPPLQLGITPLAPATDGQAAAQANSLSGEAVPSAESSASTSPNTDRMRMKSVSSFVSPTAHATLLVRGLSGRVAAAGAADADIPDWAVHFPALHYASPMAAQHALSNVGLESARTHVATEEGLQSTQATRDGSVSAKAGRGSLASGAARSSVSGHRLRSFASDSSSAIGSGRSATPRFTPRGTPRVTEDDLRMSVAEMRERVRQEVRGTPGAGAVVHVALGTVEEPCKPGATDAAVQVGHGRRRPSVTIQVAECAANARTVGAAASHAGDASATVEHALAVRTPGTRRKKNATGERGASVGWGKLMPFKEPAAYAWLPDMTLYDEQHVKAMRELLGSPDLEAAAIVMTAPTHLAGDELRAYVEAKQSGRGSQISPHTEDGLSRRGDESARSGDGPRLIAEQFLDELKERNEVINAVPPAVISRRRLSGLGLDALLSPSLLSPTLGLGTSKRASGLAFTALRSPLPDQAARFPQQAPDGAMSNLPNEAEAVGEGIANTDSRPSGLASGQAAAPTTEPASSEQRDSADDSAPDAPQLAVTSAHEAAAVDDTTFVFVAKTLRLPYKPVMEAMIAKSIPSMAHEPRITAVDDSDEASQGNSQIARARRPTTRAPTRPNPLRAQRAVQHAHSPQRTVAAVEPSPNPGTHTRTARTYSRGSHAPGLGLSPQRPLAKPQAGRATIFSSANVEPNAPKPPALHAARPPMRNQRAQRPRHAPFARKIAQPASTRRWSLHGLHDGRSMYSLPPTAHAAATALQRMLRPGAIITGDISRMLAAGVAAPFSVHNGPLQLGGGNSVGRGRDNRSPRWITVFPGADDVAQEKLAHAVEDGLIPVRPSGTPIPIGVDETVSDDEVYQQLTQDPPRSPKSPHSPHTLDLTTARVAANVDAAGATTQLTAREHFSLMGPTQLRPGQRSPRLVLLSDVPVNTVMPRVREVEVPAGTAFVPAILRIGAGANHDAKGASGSPRGADGDKGSGGMLFATAHSPGKRASTLDSDQHTAPFLKGSRAPAVPLVPPKLMRHRMLLSNMLFEALERQRLKDQAQRHGHAGTR